LQLAQPLALLLGVLALRHVDVGSDHFDQLTAGRKNRAADRVDVPDSPVRQDDPELFDISAPLARHLVAALTQLIAILRMDPLQNRFAIGNRLLRIEVPNAIRFLGPVDLAGAVESPAAGVGQPLRFREVIFASPQLSLYRPAFDRDARQMRYLLDDLLIARAGPARLAIIHGEGRYHLALRRQDRRRPTGTQAVRQSDAAIFRPQGVGGDVLDDDLLGAIGGRAAGAGRGSDHAAVDR